MQNNVQIHISFDVAVKAWVNTKALGHAQYNIDSDLLNEIAM